MRIKVKGSVHYEGIVEILNPEETLKSFNTHIYRTDIKGIAEHVAYFSILREEKEVEGVGIEGKDYLIENASFYDGDLEADIQDETSHE